MDVDAVLDRRRLKRRLTWWRVAAVLLAFVVIAVLLSRDGEVVGPHVARMTVEGVIIDDYAREEQLDRLAKDDSVKAVLVRIDSPGGTVVGSEVIYEGLRKIAEKKPVVAVMSTVGASGGYIVALGADRIYARENTLTGSIGVIFQAPDLSRLLNDLGISVNEIKTSPVKGGPSIFEPMTEAQREAIEVMVDDAFDWFKGIVAERRGYDAQQLAVVADGRVYSGRQALENGLIDALGSEDDALAWLHDAEGIDPSLPVRESKPQQDIPFFSQVVDRTAAWITGDSDFSQRLSLDGLLALWHP